MNTSVAALLKPAPESDDPVHWTEALRADAPAIAARKRLS